MSTGLLTGETAETYFTKQLFHKNLPKNAVSTTYITIDSKVAHIYSFAGSLGSPESVNSIKEKVQLLKNNKISACVASMDNVLDVVKETFDIILSTYAIYYSKNQLNLINSLKSLLNKNGVILISGPGKFSNKEIIDLMNSLDGENKIDTVDDFINIDDINRLKDTYEKVETFRLNNFVNFDNYINVNNWWKNHSIYKKELDKEFTDYLKKHFKKNKLFSITKNILAIKIYVQQLYISRI